VRGLQGLGLQAEVTFTLADTETHEGLGGVVNALEAAKELKESKSDVRVIFDGAGTKWVGELAKPEHRVHPSVAKLVSDGYRIITF
jgi:hypothetical protein